MCAVHIWVLMCPEFLFHSFPTSIFPGPLGAHPPSGGAGGHSACFQGWGVGSSRSTRIATNCQEFQGWTGNLSSFPGVFFCAKCGEIAWFPLYHSCPLSMVWGCSFLICVFPTWRRTLWKKRKVIPGHRQVKRREMNCGRGYSRPRRKLSEYFVLSVPRLSQSRAHFIHPLFI